MWFWVVIVLAWLLVIGISVRNRRLNPTSHSYSSTETTKTYSKEIPKIIYTFWDSYPENVPPIVEKSIDTWKKQCTGYDIRVLNYDNTSHMNIKHRESPARYSDFVRLYVLEETGGIWMDASVFLNKPIDDWLTQGDHDYTGYYGDYHTSVKEWPVVESWFMAAPKGSQFIKDWKGEFFRANEFDSMGDYVDDLLEKGVDAQNFHDSVNYLAVYLANQYCIQKLGREYDLNLMSSDEDAMKYILDNKNPLMWLWGEPAVSDLCENLEKYKDSTRMIKITNVQRPHLNEECTSKL
jgi:hypothetical protein